MAPVDVIDVTDFEFRKQNDHIGLIIIADNLSPLVFQCSKTSLHYMRIDTLLSFRSRLYPNIFWENVIAFFHAY